jgi:hypothetical protein
MKRFILTLLLPVFLLAGCTEAFIQEDGGAPGYDYSTFIAATVQAPDKVTDHSQNALSGHTSTLRLRSVTTPLSGQSKVETRGKPLNDDTEIPDMGIFCSATGTVDWAPTDAPGYFSNRRMIRNARGVWEFASNPLAWNPVTANDRYTFFAYAPYGTGLYDASANQAGNGITITGTESTPGIPSLLYTVPAKVENQPDLMVAAPRYNIRPIGNPVRLRMEHALACVGFQIAGQGEEITGISISGVYVSGSLSMDGTTGGSGIVWNPVGVPATTDFSASLNVAPYKANAGMSENLIAGDGYLMMIPQKLGSNAKIKITFSGNIPPREIGLDGYEWVAGKKTMYHITLTPLGTITIEPGNLTMAHVPTSDVIRVICKDNSGNDVPTIPWTLASSDPWLTLSLNPNGAGAAATVSGAGSQSVYLFATDNPYVASRTTTITKDAATVVTVTQLGRPVVPPGGGDLPHNVPTYTGAFWRYDQTGERIIKINVGPAINGNHGEWQVSAIWYDANWVTANGDGIVFAAGGSGDPKIYGNDPGDAEGYQVTGNAAISGNVEPDGTILFRIGLKTPFTAYHEMNNPARYAVILLSYNNYNRHQRIYIRQGEGADYLMRTSDPIPSGGARGACARFLPYNLTATDLNALVPVRGGELTDFPTQAGALFQWGNPNKIRFAWAPYSVPAQNWMDDLSSHFWNNISGEHEVCPPGYRRPNDGSITANEANSDISRSEMRLSLIRNTTAGSGTLNAENTVLGFYADGFFDRRQTTGSGPSTTVAPNTDRVASIGRLFYNLETNASLFFPITGYRMSDNGAFITDRGVYWTSSVGGNNNNNGWLLIFGGSTISMTLTPKGYGGSIRCVRE